jgi:hypothetical protein
MKKRHFSGILMVARVPIGCWREDAPAGATGHTLQLKSYTRQTMLKKYPHLKRRVCVT